MARVEPPKKQQAEELSAVLWAISRGMRGDRNRVNRFALIEYVWPVNPDTEVLITRLTGEFVPA